MNAFTRRTSLALLVLAAAVAPLLAQSPFPQGPGQGMPRPQPVGGLNQSGWSGTENLPGYGPLHFSFLGPDRVVMTDADRRPVLGLYSLQGRTVRLLFYNNTVRYDGEIDGPVRPGAWLKGTASNGRQQWTFEVRMQDGPPNPPTPRAGTLPGGVTVPLDPPSPPTPIVNPPR
jgi:hypothetical protein